MRPVTVYAAIAFMALSGAAYAQDAGTATSQTDHNPAVATSSASTATPAKGANSFTHKQATHRIVKHGFTDVKDLSKDSDGIWHATAMQNGASTKVWLDYKGDVGTE